MSAGGPDFLNPPVISRASAKLGLLLATVILVMIPTMAPGPGFGSTPPWCVFCGERGGSDAIANTILFVPLGIALGFQRWTVVQGTIFALGVTVFIETSQLLVIPGRDAGIGDLIFNTSGGVLGLVAVRTARWWLMPNAVTARVLPVAYGIVAASVFVVSGLLFEPDFDAPSYRSQWQQRRSRRDVYQGSIQAVTLGGRAIPDGAVADPDYIRTALPSGQSIEITGTGGPQPRGLGAIYTIRGTRNRDIWTAAQRGADLVFHYRPRAADLRLQEPNFTVPRAMESIADDTPFRLTVSRQRPGFRATLNGESFDLAFAARDAWRLFLYPFGIPRSMRWILGWGWMVALAFPLGLWLAHPSSTTIGVVLFGLGLTIPWWLGYLSTPGAVEGVGTGLGILLGALASRIASRMMTVKSA